MLDKDLSYSTVFSYLKSLNFHFVDAWVIQCINYCMSTYPNLTLDSLKNVVKEQWLLVNLRTLKVPALPANLATYNKTILQGKYMVQVESMIDCRKSYFSQLQKLQNINLENIEATKEPKEREKNSERCLTFEITDGVQDLQALEYKPIKKIKVNDPSLLPGFKMLVIGPVECRKGMILLKEENVEIYGGEVDTLTSTNNLKSILMRKLNITEDNIPDNNKTIVNEVVHVDRNEIMENTRSPTATSEQNIETLFDQNDEVFLSLPFDDNLLPQENQNSGDSAHCSMYNTPDAKLLPVNTNVNVYSGDVCMVEKNLKKSDVRTLKKHSLTPEDKTTPSSKKISYDPELEFNFSTDNSRNRKDSEYTYREHLRENLNFSENKLGMIKKSEESFQNRPVAFQSSGPSTRMFSSGIPSENKLSGQHVINPEPFVYLKHINTLKLMYPCLFTIKGIILTLKKKITIENEEYNLRGTITDGSKSIDVNFSSKIIENMIEYSPCEMQTMLKSRQLNTALNSRINECFRRAQEKLISLNCLMKIKFFPNGEIPLILFLEEVTVHHLNALKKRFESASTK